MFNEGKLWNYFTVTTNKCQYLTLITIVTLHDIYNTTHNAATKRGQQLIFKTQI